jgi:hypothetical protein
VRERKAVFCDAGSGSMYCQHSYQTFWEILVLITVRFTDTASCVNFAFACVAGLQKYASLLVTGELMETGGK